MTPQRLLHADRMRGMDPEINPIPIRPSFLLVQSPSLLVLPERPTRHQGPNRRVPSDQWQIRIDPLRDPRSRVRRGGSGSIASR